MLSLSLLATCTASMNYFNLFYLCGVFENIQPLLVAHRFDGSCTGQESWRLLAQ
jgi:hypothetical protein